MISNLFINLLEPVKQLAVGNGQAMGIYLPSLGLDETVKELFGSPFIYVERTFTIQWYVVYPFISFLGNIEC